jgi:hypothetical protein
MVKIYYDTEDQKYDVHIYSIILRLWTLQKSMDITTNIVKETLNGTYMDSKENCHY